MFRGRVGEIQEYRNDGHGVILKERICFGCSLKCNRMAPSSTATSSSRSLRASPCSLGQATGFLLNDEVPKICDRQKIYPFDVMDFNLLCLILNSLDVFGTDSVRYGAEPLLDGAQFGSAKGRVAEEEQVSDEAPRRESRDIYSILYIYIYIDLRCVKPSQGLRLCCRRCIRAWSRCRERGFLRSISAWTSDHEISLAAARQQSLRIGLCRSHVRVFLVFQVVGL